MSTSTKTGIETATETAAETAAEGPGTDFEAVKAFTSAPEAVLAALTTPEGVAAWWGTTAGSPVEGDRFAVGFGSERRIDLIVTSVGPRGVAWSVEAAPHTPEWDGTTIAFDIASDGDGAVVRFRHHGLTPRLECFEMCHAGWTHYLASLVDYVDTGVGDPYRPD